VKDDQLKPHKDAERQKFAPVQLQLFAHKVKDDKEKNENREKRIEDFVARFLQLYALKRSQNQHAEISDEYFSDILLDPSIRKRGSTYRRRRRW